MKTYQAVVEEYTVREETLNGIDYIVAPVVLMVEGVHSGNRGPLLHTMEELGKIPESWNGIPVTIGHPQINGEPVPANSPDVYQEWAVGIIFNTVVDGSRIKAEAWLEKEKLQTNNENLFDRINNSEIIEISVGVFSEEEEVEGTWNSETYIAIARNFRPEHLALLPNQTGACSVAKGCGIRINSKNMVVNEKNRKAVLREVRQQGYKVDLTVFEGSLTEKVNKVRSKLYAMDSENAFYYVEEIYDSYLIYQKEDRVSDDSKLYKQTYAMAADETVEFIGEPMQVNKNVEYVIVNNAGKTVRERRKININLKKEENMTSKECPTCKAKVDALIANKVTTYAEGDREWLETLEETQLDKMVPVEVEKVVEKEATITPEMAINALKEGLKGQEDWINLMPENMQEQTRSALTLHEARKTALVNGIITNTVEGTWEKVELEGMAVGQLEKIAKTAGFENSTIQNNFAGMGAGAGTKLQTNEGADVPPMAPVGIKFETKE